MAGLLNILEKPLGNIFVRWGNFVGKKTELYFDLSQNSSKKKV